MDNFLIFLDSNFFQSIVALIVGVFVFVQYRINRRDHLRDAASIIIIEIQTASRTIKSIRKRLVDRVLDSDVSVMPSDSWKENRQLFAKYLDRDEWDTIEDFYDRARLLDDVVKYNRQMFRNDVEQIRINKQRAAADFAIDTVNNIAANNMNKEDVANMFSGKVSVYDTLYMSKQGELAYTPNQVTDDAKKYIDNIPDILNSSAYVKLKSISRRGISRKNRI
ncbi:MAG: hypothetical protein HXK98_02115 [Candidatus Nanogingivalaceae bacterium]|nr:hypothetical protein [Candidatus Nanogingivalaceae bacterium]